MDPFNAPDEIRTTKGDLIEFPRRIFPFFMHIPILTYFHFAVYTVDSEADAGLTNVQLPVGDRITAGVDLLPFSICDFLLKRFRIPYKIVEKTIRKLCKNELGCRVNNLEEAAKEKGLEPFDPDVIVERARQRLRRRLCQRQREDFIGNYNLLTENCEHFATMCRYGEGFSLQAARGQYLLWKLGQLYSKTKTVLISVLVSIAFNFWLFIFHDILLLTTFPAKLLSNE